MKNLRELMEWIEGNIDKQAADDVLPEPRVTQQIKCKINKIRKIEFEDVEKEKE